MNKLNPAAILRSINEWRKKTTQDHIEILDKLNRLSEMVEAQKGEEAQRRTIEKLDEALFYGNMLKNNATIPTGDYEALTRLFTGQKMYVDTRDISLAPHLMMDGQWEPEITTHWRNFVKPDSTILDIGANFGFFGIVAGTDIQKKGAQIHLFEPNELLCKLIRKTIAVNGLYGSARVVQKAVGAEEGEVTIRYLKDYWGSSSASGGNLSQEFEVERSVTVPTVAIDDYCAENKLEKVDLVKIDVEGFEDQVYKGMKKTIEKNKEHLALFLEFTFAAYKNSEKFFDTIKSDFKHIYGIMHDGSLVDLKDYNQAQKVASDAWMMMIATNNKILQKK